MSRYVFDMDSNGRYWGRDTKTGRFYGRNSVSGQVYNYLSIQLRDMGQLNPKKTTSLRSRYLFVPIWEDRFNKAYKDAVPLLTMPKATAQNNPFLRQLKDIYDARIQKEKSFLNTWQAAHPNSNTNILYNQIKNPPALTINNYEKIKQYADNFSTFVKSALTQDNDIVNALRDSAFSERMSSVKNSMIASRAAVTSSRKEKLNNLNLTVNEYFRDLFNLFFFDKKNMTNKNKIQEASIERVQKYLKSSIIDKNLQNIFEQKFQEFVNKYYPEIQQRFDLQVDDEIFGKIVNNVYKVLNSGKTKNIKVKVTDGKTKGVSGNAEQQLKKMFLQTMREFMARDGKTQFFSISGLIEITPVYSQQEDSYHNAVQVYINEERDAHDKIGNRKFSYLWNIFSAHLFKNLEAHIKRPLTEEEKRDLKKATLEGVNKKGKSGKKYLDSMTAYEYYSVKGLMGEIATAYELNSSGKVVAGTTGAERVGSGQINYDVVMEVLGKKFGLQVKNYKNANAVLYKTQFTFGWNNYTKKYFPKDDITKYQFLLANGKLISSVKRRPNLLQNIADSFVRYTENFMRISSADNIRENINSDIYVIGKEYYPASYLIFKMYEKARKQIGEGKGPDGSYQNFFTIHGDFPEPKTYKQSQNIVRIKDHRLTQNFKVDFKGISI